MSQKSILQRVFANFRIRRDLLSVGLSILILVGAITFVPAFAAQWPAEFYNPSPADDDVVLAMPCGGAMTFRKIAIPNEGPLHDYPIMIGGTDDGRGFAENVHPAYIAGSFGENSAERYYLLGKYEVNRLQYAAINESCLKPDLSLRLPQVNISWFDAVNSADRYSRWLRTNAADTLPKDGKETGFVRLPTEVEWEFATRGGTAVSPADFRERVFPTPEGLARYVWFASTESANRTLQFGGLLKPNPLGLHDILGNVDEIVLEPFRLNRLDRLHGQAGGYIVRGGNYYTSETDMRSSYRQEVPYYKGGTTRQSETTGFRLAVVGPVITSREKLRSIESAWSQLGSASSIEEHKADQKPKLTGQPLDDPVKELGVIADAADDDSMKERLAGVQTQLKTIQANLRANIQERDDQRDRAAKARLRLGTFLCQKLKDDGLPIDAQKDLYTKCVELRGAEHQRCQQYRSLVESNEAAQLDNLRYYADTIVDLTRDYNEPVLEKQLSVLRTELTARGLRALISFADQYHQHAENYRKSNTIQRADWLKDCKK